VIISEIVAYGATMAAWGFSLGWQVCGMYLRLGNDTRYVFSRMVVSLIVLAIMGASAVVAPVLVFSVAAQAIVTILMALATLAHYKAVGFK